MTGENSLAGIVHMMNGQQSREKLKLLEELRGSWSNYGEIRDKSLLKKIAFCNIETLDAVLAEHPSRPTVVGLEGVNSAFVLLELSRDAFIEICGAFHGRVLHDSQNDLSMDLWRKRATKEAFTYSVAAESLVQAYRHLLSKVPVIKGHYDILKAEVFNDGTDKIIKCLRNANNHDGIFETVPNYKIELGDKRTVSTQICFAKKEVFGSHSWSKKVLAHFEQSPSLEVIYFLNNHFEQAKKFKRLLPHRTGIDTDVSYRDYRRILLANKTQSQIMWVGVLLQQALPKMLDPYEYIERHFTVAELENIYSFKNGSKEQVDYMISLRDPIGLIDEKTVDDLYKIFRVNDR